MAQIGQPNNLEPPSLPHASPSSLSPPLPRNRLLLLRRLHSEKSGIRVLAAHDGRLALAFLSIEIDGVGGGVWGRSRCRRLLCRGLGEVVGGCREIRAVGRTMDVVGVGEGVMVVGLRVVADGVFDGG